jgi:hypothetical protein
MRSPVFGFFAKIALGDNGGTLIGSRERPVPSVAVLGNCLARLFQESALRVAV